MCHKYFPKGRRPSIFSSSLPVASPGAAGPQTLWSTTALFCIRQSPRALAGATSVRRGVISRALIRALPGGCGCGFLVFPLLLLRDRHCPVRSPLVHSGPVSWSGVKQQHPEPTGPRPDRGWCALGPESGQKTRRRCGDDDDEGATKTRKKVVRGEGSSLLTAHPPTPKTSSANE